MLGDRSIDWLIGYLVLDRYVRGSIDWLIDWIFSFGSICQGIDRLIDWLDIYFWIDMSGDRSIDWLIGYLVLDRYVRGSIDWLIDWNVEDFVLSCFLVNFLWRFHAKTPERRGERRGGSAEKIQTRRSSLATHRQFTPRRRLYECDARQTRILLFFLFIGLGFVGGSARTDAADTRWLQPPVQRQRKSPSRGAIGRRQRISATLLQIAQSVERRWCV